MMGQVSQSVVESVLRQVPDPEIPKINIVDLGMVEQVWDGNGTVSVTLIPTFVGCSAQRVIEDDVRTRLSRAFPDQTIEVRFSLTTAWSSDRISEEGREALKASGIAPPGDRLENVSCPFCGNTGNILQNLFGATSCRSLFYCGACRNPFEAFKPM